MPSVAAALARAQARARRSSDTSGTQDRLFRGRVPGRCGSRMRSGPRWQGREARDKGPWVLACCRRTLRGDGAGVYRVAKEAGMWVIFLEAGIALALLLTIVWATWPKRGNDDKDRNKDDVE